MEKLTKLEALEKDLLMVFGEDSKVKYYKALGCCNIVRVINENGGQQTLARFNTVKECQAFLDGLKSLAWHGVIDIKVNN